MDREVVGREAGEIEVGVSGDRLGDNQLGGIVLRRLLETRRDMNRVADRGEVEALAQPIRPTTAGPVWMPIPIRSGEPR